MKKITFALLTLTLLISCSQKQEKKASSEKPTVKIGFVLPLTGNNAHAGLPQQYAAQLAFEKLKNKNTKYNYEYIFEDDRLDPKFTNTAANKLINVDKVDAIVSMSSGSGNVISPLTQINKVIHLAIASDPNIAKGNFNFIHWTTPSSEAKALVNTLIQKGFTHPVLITLNQQGCLAVKDAILESIKDFPSIQMLSVEKFNTGERDFRTMLTRLSQQKPDIFILFALSPELEIIAKQIKELGISIPLTSVETFEYTSDYSLFEGNWYIHASEIDDALRQKFYDKFGPNCPIVAAGNLFDCINILFHVYEDYPSNTKPTTTQIAQAILDLKTFDGVLGKLTIPPSGIIDSPATLKEIRNGKPVVISRNP